jgi:formylglycine-generating enzyme required for sulfatase activity
MGSPDQEAGRDAQERLHEVVIRQPFLMGRYPVGQAEYEQVMGHNPSHFKGDRLPVENVTWQEASEFCKRVSVRTQRAVRLPTEAEWEYACRATTRSRFCAGDYDLDLERVAWFRGTSGNTTHTVGDKEANLFGLGDMHGNVAEWCQDWFAENYYAQSPGCDPPGPATGTSRVVRGGNWSSAPASCRSAARDRYRPVNRYDVVGFRIVVSA